MTTHYTSENFSIVIPIYNEEEILESSFNEIASICEKTRIKYEIILVENGSTDKTKEIASKLTNTNSKTKVINLTNPNYGNALKQGFLASKNDLIVSFDIDYFSESFLNEALFLEREFTALTASKRMSASKDDRKIVRKLATKLFVLILKTLFSTNLSDTHGMKAIRRVGVVEHIGKVVSTQDLFDTELLLRIERSNQLIKEVPANVNEIRPSVSLIFTRIPRTLFSLMRLRFYLSKEGLKTKTL
ncbi:MAG: glycosyltransferase family 2 protein [Actinomycetota bacterium]|nr:glycosyltransferase family 2 protein [Actinomycetota bacterium]